MGTRLERLLHKPFPACLKPFFYPTRRVRCEWSIFAGRDGANSRAGARGPDGGSAGSAWEWAELLLGVREGGRTRIVDSLEIPCCHSGGPSFRLTPEEMQQARETMTEAAEITAKTRIAVVGWYCSKTRGDAVAE